MPDGRAVVVTGASRGLGLATAAHLHRAGWTVVAAVRSPATAIDALRAATGAPETDTRLLAVGLDLLDRDSIGRAAGEILERVGAPHGLVHNAGIAGVGCLEEMPDDYWEQVHTTNYLGPVRLTRALLPPMRHAGRGRIVMVSSEGALHGMPGIGAYSAAKGAVERWAESLSQEVAPFGIGVTVLVAGTFKTDILERTPTFADRDGPYGSFHDHLERSGRRFIRIAASPDRFAPAVQRALEEEGPFRRHAVGIDARLLLIGSRLLPTRALRWSLEKVLRLPSSGSLVGDRHQTAVVSDPT
ncbi:MAG: SDR family NAD(P)-dependent oxidoreductase [Acidimicrobiales bacterium]